MPLSQYAGLLYPTDLEVLQKVFARLCKERGMDPRGHNAELLAKRLIRLHELGFTEEDALLRAAAGPSP